MEEVHACKRRRVYSFEPNAVLRAIFSQKYLNCLLPSLLKISRERSSIEKEECEIEKVVRFEVDMALVLSANMFRWSHALKRKLESDFNVKDLLYAPTPHEIPLSLLLTYKPDGTFVFREKANDISPMLPLPRSLTPTGFSRNCNSSSSWEESKSSKRVQRGRKRKSEKGGNVQFGCRLKTLRKLLPGGDEMGVHELLSEVESYVLCLESQVSILQSLVDTH